ncbi:hypothetical protein K3727_13120 [Rhodobacteraceae bacterium M382]|nr:hypothetical protein K3727_13120 [Rhodobacteraceae bacterium M382]
MTHVADLRTALVALALLSPTAAVAQDYRTIETAADFAAHVVGKTLRWSTGETRILADGTTRGEMQNIGQYHGSWIWEDGYYCRSLIVNETKSDQKCLLVEIAGDRLRMSYGKGDGRSLELEIGSE